MRGLSDLAVRSSIWCLTVVVMEDRWYSVFETVWFRYYRPWVGIDYFGCGTWLGTVYESVLF